MCDRFISEDLPGQYKAQKMCNEAVDDFLAALRFFPDWFFTS